MVSEIIRNSDSSVFFFTFCNSYNKYNVESFKDLHSMYHTPFEILTVTNIK